MGDKQGILSRRNAFIGQVNSVLCYFGNGLKLGPKSCGLGLKTCGLSGLGYITAEDNNLLCIFCAISILFICLAQIVHKIDKQTRELGGKIRRPADFLVKHKLFLRNTSRAVKSLIRVPV